jgi:hypothetical protein
VCEGRNRFPETEDGLLGQDGADVRFAPIGGHALTPEVFLAKAMNERASLQSTKAFPPATARVRRNVVTSLVDLT